MCLSRTCPWPPCGSLPFHYLLCNDPPLPHHPPSNWLRLFSSQTFSHMDAPTILKFSHYTPTCLWWWNRQSVPKCQRIKFGRLGITQKKTYNKQKVTYRCFSWNSCQQTASKHSVPLHHHDLTDFCIFNSLFSATVLIL